MRASFFILALTALVASAGISPELDRRGLIDFPKCAVPCLVKTPRGGCGMTDYHCLCHNDDFVKKSTECIQEKCSGGDQDKARAAQAKTCKGQ